LVELRRRVDCLLRDDSFPDGIHPIGECSSPAASFLLNYQHRVASPAVRELRVAYRHPVARDHPAGLTASIRRWAD
jgi:hypothetical protein